MVKTRLQLPALSVLSVHELICILRIRELHFAGIPHELFIYPHRDAAQTDRLCKRINLIEAGVGSLAAFAGPDPLVQLAYWSRQRFGRLLVVPHPAFGNDARIIAGRASQGLSI